MKTIQEAENAMKAYLATDMKTRVQKSKGTFEEPAPKMHRMDASVSRMNDLINGIPVEDVVAQPYSIDNDEEIYLRSKKGVGKLVDELATKEFPKTTNTTPEPVYALVSRPRSKEESDRLAVKRQAAFDAAPKTQSYALATVPKTDLDLTTRTLPTENIEPYVPAIDQFGELKIPEDDPVTRLLGQVTQLIEKVTPKRNSDAELERFIQEKQVPATPQPDNTDTDFLKAKELGLAVINLSKKASELTKEDAFRLKKAYTRLQ
jgi:hypothetical protein